MKNETRYIVSDAVSIPVIRIVSKGEAYRMVTKPGWGLVEWYSAEDGYKNPVNRDRSDKTQVMYCDDDCEGAIYGKDGSAFYILPTVERRLGGLFPAILRRFPLPYVSMAAENLLV